MILKRSAILAVALCAPLRADFDPAHYRFRRPVEIASPAPLISLEADPVLYKGSGAHLADVRVIRGDQEIAYLLKAPEQLRSPVDVPAIALNKSVIPGAGATITLDAGPGNLHDGVTISTELKDFKQRVRIETSDNRRQWNIVRDDGYIVSFAQGDQPLSVLDVSYPISDRRFVRVTVFGWMNPAALRSASLQFVSQRRDVRRTTATFPSPSRVEDAKAQATVLTLDIGYQGLPHSAAVFRVGAGFFSRPVVVESSADGNNWSRLTQCAITRTEQGEWLAINYPEVWDRYLRLSILNRDDRPLPSLAVDLQTIVREIVFPGASGLSWIYYGDPDARQPTYDLASILPASASAAHNARMGAQEENPAYRAPEVPQKPLSDRYPNLLYGLLAASIAGMGYVTWRVWRKLNLGS